MSEPGPPASRRRVGVLDTLAWKTGALVVVSALAILLWRFALPEAAYAVSALGAPVTATATVTGCAAGDDHACTVTYAGPGGDAVVAPLQRHGVFAVAAGEKVDVAVAADGTVGLGAGRAGLDALLLLGLALALTVYTVGWFRRVIEHGDAFGDDDDPPDPWDEGSLGH